MGHRSWLVEVKNETELKKVVRFIAQADKLCKYLTFAEFEVYCKYEGKLLVGFCSDGTRCGEIFEKKVLPKNRDFELLGEGIEPEDLSYMSQARFLSNLMPKASKEKRDKLKTYLNTQAKKREKEIDAILNDD